MKNIRDIILYENHFENFLISLPTKNQNKIFKVFEIIETIEMIPKSFLKHLAGTDGLYEIRVRFSTNQIRIFCFFDKENLVVVLNGFTKKTKKTPKRELNRALKLKQKYYQEKKEKK